jgi:hypothetical protein
VPDPVMFRRFLDATDYWFSYSDNSSAGSYDPARGCFVVLANNQANSANAAEAGDGGVPPGPGTGPRQGAGQSALPSSPPRGADINAQLAQARELEAKLSSRTSTTRCGCFEPPSLGKPPRAANERVSWASKPASASTPTSMSTTRTCSRERARSSSPPRHFYGPCPPLSNRGAEPAPRGAGAHRASDRSAGRKLGVPYPLVGEHAGRRGRARPRTIGTCGRRSGTPRQPRAHAGQGADRRHARAGPRR